MFSRALNKTMLNILQYDENITINQTDFRNSIESMQKSRDLQIHKQQIYNNKKPTGYQQLAAKFDSIVNESTPDKFFDICLRGSKMKSLVFDISYMTYVI